MSEASFKLPEFKFSKPKKRKSEDRALETKGSNLGKFLDVISRPGAVTEGEAIDLIRKFRGEDAKYSPKDILTGKQARPSGSDIIKEIRQKSAESTPGKIAEAVGGLAIDVLNPADPINWIGIGELTKAGQAAQKLGKLSKFSTGLQKGERSIVSLRLPFQKTGLALAPKAASANAGRAFEAIGRGIKATPVLGKTVEGIGKFFKPKYDKLKEYSHKQAARASELTSIFKKSGETMKWPKLMKEATERIKSGELKLKNPEMAAHYESLGYNAEQMANAEVKRVLDEGIAARGTGGASGKAVQALEQVPIHGETLDVVKQLAGHQAAPIKIADQMAKELGVRGSLGDIFGAPRIMSDETKALMEKAGIQAGAGSASGGAHRVFTELTSGQVEAARANPEINKELFSKMFGEAGTKPFYEMDTAKAFQKYAQSQAKQISTGEMVGQMMKDPAIARKVRAPGDIKVEMPKQFEKVMKNLKASGANVNLGHMYMTPETAHEFKNFVGLMTDQDKMNGVWGLMQPLFQILTPLTNAFKKMTLFVPPGFLPFLSHNIMGNTVQSAMVGAVSKDGVKDAIYMSNALRKAADDPDALRAIAAGLGVHNGQNLGEHLIKMQEANLFNEGFTRDFFGDDSLQKFMDKWSLAKASMKINDVAESATRIQHYMTRIHQGWTPEAAIKDVRKYLYDYAGNMSPQLQQLKSVFPFLAWTRNNVPIMFQHMITRPGKFAIPERVKQNVENTLGTDSEGNKPDERALDEYIKGDWHIRWKFDKETGKWSYLRLKNVIPMADLEDFTSISKMVDLTAASLTPFLKTAIENTANKSLFFKTAGGEAAPIENYEGETGKFLGQEFSRKTINWLRNVRPLNMANTLSGQAGSDIAANLAGFNSRAVDFSKANDYAKYAYSKKKQALLLSKHRQEQKGKSTEDLDKLLAELKAGSYVP